jgi:hypothetical protein
MGCLEILGDSCYEDHFKFLRANLSLNVEVSCIFFDSIDKNLKFF